MKYASVVVTQTRILKGRTICNGILMSIYFVRPTGACSMSYLFWEFSFRYLISVTNRQGILMFPVVKSYIYDYSLHLMRDSKNVRESNLKALASFRMELWVCSKLYSVDSMDQIHTNLQYVSYNTGWLFEYKNTTWLTFPAGYFIKGWLVKLYNCETVQIVMLWPVTFYFITSNTDFFLLVDCDKCSHLNIYYAWLSPYI